MKERIETDLLIQQNTNTVQLTDNTESIWDQPWIWIGIVVFIIISLAVAKHHLTNKNFH
jgi:hypothetical protein